MISRVLRFDDNDDNSVPKAQNPKVPRNTTTNSGPRCDKRSISKNIIKRGRIKSSMIDKKIRLLINLPKYIAVRSAGTSISPIRQPFSFSNIKDRFNPIVPANRNATHRIPGPTSLAFTILRLIEKIKIKITNNAKINIALSSSRVFSSVTKSFHTIAVI